MLAGMVDLINHNIYCGAVIICPTFIMTAAHCLENKNITEIAVVVGEHDVTTGNR